MNKQQIINCALPLSRSTCFICWKIWYDYRKYYVDFGSYLINASKNIKGHKLWLAFKKIVKEKIEEEHYTHTKKEEKYQMLLKGLSFKSIEVFVNMPHIKASFYLI